MSGLLRKTFVPWSFFLGLAVCTPIAYTQTTPSITVPSPLEIRPTVQQQSALQNETSAQDSLIRATFVPRMQQIIQNHNSQQASVGNFRTWQNIIANSNKGSDGTLQNSSATGIEIHFNSISGSQFTARPAIREYHPAAEGTANVSNATLSPLALTAAPQFRPVLPIMDQDGDGLLDNPKCGLATSNCDFEDKLAQAFMPVYFISTGEQQQFATFGNYVPWTVVSLVGTTPPNSYYHVTPLGIASDSSGNQLYAVRVDYLSLWNADGGLVGGDAACFYSYFGLDSVINQLSGHELDAERSVMLLAAPVVNGGFNPDPNAYMLYSIYTAAHEGTFFDQSEYADLSTPIASGNHIELYQSVSKHSTYGFNPNYYPITPAWFIVATNEAITDEYLDGDLDDETYALILAAADDTFYGCLVERFGDQGWQAPSPITNVGEVAFPINGSAFIQDDSSRALNLADKLTNPVF